jgi:hypothetical protein
MGMEDVRAAFLAAGAGRLRLDRASLRYTADGQQVISVSGWHDDGMPFASASAPFAGDPGRRAQEIAADLIRTHTGRPAEPTQTTAKKSVPMSHKVSGLARLMAGLKTINDDADALADELEQALGRVKEQLPVTRQIVATARKAADDLQAVNSQYSNGDPTSDGSAGPSTPQR